MGKKKHLGVQCIFHVGSQGGYTALAMIPLPAIPVTGDPIIDRILIGIPLALIGFLIARDND